MHNKWPGYLCHEIDEDTSQMTEESGFSSQKCLGLFCFPHSDLLWCPPCRHCGRYNHFIVGRVTCT